MGESAPTDMRQCCCYNNVVCILCETHGTGPLMHHFSEVRGVGTQLDRVTRPRGVQEVRGG